MIDERWVKMSMEQLRMQLAAERAAREKAEAEREAAQADNVKVFLDNGILEREREAWREVAQRLASSLRPNHWSKDLDYAEKDALASYDALVAKEENRGQD
jgi:hypothetical protein